MKDNKIQVALLGFGTVGTGAYKVLQRQKKEMLSKLGVEVELAKILVRNREKAEKKVDDKSLITTEWADIVEDPTIDIVVEVMGGMEPARTYILDALKHGKNVVTANKDLIAVDGRILMDTAREQNRDFLYEAAVAGGIPIISPLKQSLYANHIEEIVGIVNGTTNFILTKMTEQGMEFDEALKLAMDLGYAEADPTADVKGLDAARKVAILASIAFNSRVTFDDVYIEGITKITARDIQYAKEMGCHIKLFGIARSNGEDIEVSVHPMLIDSRHPLASVNDSFNAVFVRGDAVGDTMFYGRGAGELPTASAIVGDVFNVAQNMIMNCCGRIHCTCYKTLPIRRKEDVVSRYFLRMQVDDRPGVLAAVTSVFGNNKVSIEQFIQKRKKGDLAELVVITEDVLERDFNDSLQILEALSMIKEISSVIRVYR
ncbi:MAG: homoserine dehydrogenase [Eubacteriales bacterium]|nr:homoserine dehydrogenase [Eubacteriales bacterium]